MRNEKDALAKIESFFRDDEMFFLVQILPRIYVFSGYVLITILLYVSIWISIFYRRIMISPLIALLLLTAGGLLLYFIGTRSFYLNSIVVSQYSIYRYIKKQIAQVDEIQWSNVKSIVVKPWRIAPTYATVIIRCNRSYTRQLPFIKRLYAIRHVQERPEKVDSRDLSLGKPIRLHLVIRRYEVFYRVLDEIRMNNQYTYALYRKRGPHV